MTDRPPLLASMVIQDGNTSKVIQSHLMGMQMASHKHGGELMLPPHGRDGIDWLRINDRLSKLRNLMRLHIQSVSRGRDTDIMTTTELIREKMEMPLPSGKKLVVTKLKMDNQIITN